MNERSFNFKKRSYQIFLLILFLSALSQLNVSSISRAYISSTNTNVDTIPHGCTVFTLSKGNQVYFGGNDDYIEPDSYYWIQPSTPNSYGAIWIGFPENVQQGVNEKGLAYDANGLPKVDVASHSERQPVFGGYTSYPVQILKECASVIEVIEWVKSHTWHTYMHDQMHFADSSGDAVIISAGVDGELVFTRKSQQDGYLVSTNFNVANPNNGFSYPCWRYQTAQQVLGRLLGQESLLTPSDVASVLDAVHVDGGASWTIVSLVADLSNGVVYLYYFHQFNNPVVINVTEEIANPRATGPISNLFPEEVQLEAANRYQHIQALASRLNIYGIAWFGIVIFSLVAYLIVSRNERQGRIFWGAVILILGPLALLAWQLSVRRQSPGTLQIALVEAIGDVTPTVVTFLIYLVLVLLIPEANSFPIQFTLIFVLPLVVGCIFFQGPLMSLVLEKGYRRVLVEKLPRVLVAANLGMAGIIAIATPFVVESLVYSWSGWTLVYFWAIVVLGAFVGVLVLMGFEVWILRHGFLLWWVLASGEGEVVSPTWRQMWWWIILSYIALFGGVLVSQLLQQ